MVAKLFIKLKLFFKVIGKRWHSESVVEDKISRFPTLSSIELAKNGEINFGFVASLKRQTLLKNLGFSVAYFVTSLGIRKD